MAKESSSGSAKKKKNKSSLLVLKSLAKKSKVQKDNPFESIWSRRKFNILGKKRKDEERRRVGLSRSLSVLKEDRRKRMAGADNPSDEDRDTSEDDEESAKRPKHLCGDDLGDSFSRSVKSKASSRLD